MKCLFCGENVNDMNEHLMNCERCLKYPTRFTHKEDLK